MEVGLPDMWFGQVSTSPIMAFIEIWQKSDSDLMAVRFRDDFFPQAINWRKSEQSDTRLSLAIA